MQIRRVLLLFALVLGLSALVASIAPQPDTRDEAVEDSTGTTTPAPARTEPMVVSFSAREQRETLPRRRVAVGSSFVLEVSVPRSGDVVVDGLGLRQSADPLTPARFAILAQPPGRYAVGFVPVNGERRVVGELAFVQPATVTPPQPAR